MIIVHYKNKIITHSKALDRRLHVKSPLCVLGKDRVEPLKIVWGIHNNLLTVCNGNANCVHDLINEERPVEHLNRSSVELNENS